MSILNTLKKVLFVEEALSVKRLAGLDILRSVAILVVLIDHGNFLVEMPFNGYGFFGVELFFVLSGFLIGSILLKKSEQDSDLSALKNFWIRRWFRTLPNYYLFLLVNVIVALLKGRASVLFLKYILFLQCFPDRVTPIMGESWSLCIEEWFYISFPVWLFLFLAMFKHKQRATLACIVSYICIFTILRVAVALLSADRDWDSGYRCATVLRLDSIGFGVMWAYIKKYHEPIFKRYRRHLLLLAIAGTICCGYIYLKSSFFDNTFLLTSTNVFLSLFLPFYYYVKIPNNYLRYGIAHVSITSYSLYLIHNSIMLQFLLFDIHLDLHVEYFIYWSGSVLFSTIIYNLFEKKMTLLRNSFSVREAGVGEVETRQ